MANGGVRGVIGKELETLSRFRIEIAHTWLTETGRDRIDGGRIKHLEAVVQIRAHRILGMLQPTRTFDEVQCVFGVGDRQAQRL